MESVPKRKLTSSVRNRLADELRKENNILRQALKKPGVKQVFTEAGINPWSIQCMYRNLVEEELEESFIRKAIINVEMIKWFIVTTPPTQKKTEQLVRWIKKGKRPNKVQEDTR